MNTPTTNKQIRVYFKQGNNQNLSSCGLLPLLKVNLVPKQPLRCSTFLMFSRSLPSTAFWAALSSSLNLPSAAFPSSTCLSLCSEAFLSSFLVNLLLFLKKESSTLTLTPSRATLLEVERTQAGLTLPRGTPFTAQGPVINRFPDLSLLRTTTLLPRCGPERRMTIDPAWMDFLPAEGWGRVFFLQKRVLSSSAGYQVFSLFLSLLLGAPPNPSQNNRY